MSYIDKKSRQESEFNQECVRLLFLLRISCDGNCKKKNCKMKGTRELIDQILSKEKYLDHNQSSLDRKFKLDIVILDE